MAQTSPINPSVLGTKKWSSVDSSTGQDISFDQRCLGFVLHVYEAGTSNYVSAFLLTAPSTSAEHDELTIKENPYGRTIAKGAGATLFNIKATSGTVDVHAEILG